MIEELDRSIVWDFDIKRPNTPVETSAYAWWPMVVKALHKEAGDGVDQTGENYRDPMYMAIHNNQVDVIVLLIHAGFEI